MKRFIINKCYLLKIMADPLAPYYDQIIINKFIKILGLFNWWYFDSVFHNFLLNLRVLIQKLFLTSR